MNLTEPQAGSDLARCARAPCRRATAYKIFGTKIFITYGEHDMAENIVHLVLARTPDAPEGVKGISLFIVPKFLVNADGSLGARNDVHCVSIEHKLGIKASPTAVLQFGDHGGAIGTLVGEENRGLEYMFIMMNAARFARRHAGRRRGRARVPEGGGVREGPRAVARPVAVRRRARGHHPPSGRAPHADDDARPDRGGARAGLCRRRGVRRRASSSPTPQRASRIRRSTNTWCRSSRAGDRDVASTSRPRRAGARRHGLHRGDRRGAVLSATRAS